MAPRRPYFARRRARERGVKLIGARAHHVTEQLDYGPIIDQDVVRVDHRQSARDLARLNGVEERVLRGRAALGPLRKAVAAGAVVLALSMGGPF